MGKQPEHSVDPPQLIREPLRAIERVGEVHAELHAQHDRSVLERQGILQALSKTHLFVSLPVDGPQAPIVWAASKLAAFEVRFEDYDRFRDKEMGGSIGPRYFQTLGDVAPPTHPAYAAIREKCAELGVSPRRDFRVIEIRATKPRDKRAAIVASAIVDLIPLLDEEGRERIRRALA